MSIYADKYRKFVGKYCEITWVETTEELKPGQHKPEKHKETITTRGKVEGLYEPKFGRDYLDVCDDRGIYLDSIKAIHELEAEESTV
ncbi:MAG: hypothetical protein P9L94_00030 [Candidatus Hinthialibacter antarcticus]|nr:hypothetical protein [Candidatus Hinthialibacter antarcticus]